ncbi:hypothetical protein Tco_1242512, partial [Tanacetum coccineum]
MRMSYDELVENNESAYMVVEHLNVMLILISLNFRYTFLGTEVMASAVEYIARKHSNFKTTGMCNSASQKAHIGDQCAILLKE